MQPVAKILVILDSGGCISLEADGFHDRYHAAGVLETAKQVILSQAPERPPGPQVLAARGNLPGGK